MKKKLFTIALILGVCIVYYNASHRTLSQPPAGTTSAPGETACGDPLLACHSQDSINVGPAFVIFNMARGLGNTYWPGKQDTITVGLGAWVVPFAQHGFETTVLDSNGASAGVLSVLNSLNTGFLTKTILTNNRQYIASKFGQPSSYQFLWDPPGSDIGTVTFYVAFIAGNQDTSGMNDREYIDTFQIKYDTTITSTRPLTPLYKNKFVVYPNPVSEQLNLRFTLLQDADVRIYMTNLKGQTVWVLMDEKQPAGHVSRNMTLNAAITPGLYFINSRIGESAIVQKVFIK